ncbi:hypothetical protein ILUMI_11960 [Ignelater luminosus]|uniref:Uncharacterized protein n=1 Tax=Ignelater luminosus TaxID=2038154 RepID=A0A8K0CZE1_IGNLU|nr:hypothetical protein ILUMI_11960 [Ignelater luminosus]
MFQVSEVWPFCKNLSYESSKSSTSSSAKRSKPTGEVTTDATVHYMTRRRLFFELSDRQTVQVSRQVRILEKASETDEQNPSVPVDVVITAKGMQNRSAAATLPKRETKKPKYLMTMNDNDNESDNVKCPVREELAPLIEDNT